MLWNKFFISAFQDLLDYEVDSDDEWEEEEPGESLSNSEVQIMINIMLSQTEKLKIPFTIIAQSCLIFQNSNRILQLCATNPRFYKILIQTKQYQILKLVKILILSMWAIGY